RNLVTKFEDPYSCPLYITGSNDSRAYWTILHNNSIIGHIPLHRSDSFHSLQSYPVLYLENDIQIVIGTDLDRNQIFPSYPNVDTLYNSTLRNIDTVFSQNKWSATVIPVIKQNEDDPQQSESQQTSPAPSPNSSGSNIPTTLSPSTSSNSVSNVAAPSSSKKKFDLYAKQLLSKNQFDLEKLSRWFIKKFNSSSPLTFAYGVSMYRKSNTKTMDLLTLKTLQTGKTYIVNLLHTFRLTPSLDYFKDPYIQKSFELSNLPQYTQKFSELEKDCQIIKTLFPTSSISIYNPFFDKYVKKTFKFYSPLTLESSFIISHPNLSNGLSTATSSSSSKEKEQPHTTIVDPVSLSSSSIPSPSSSNTSSTSTLPFVSISNTESSNNENILDKLKKLDKKIKIERQQQSEDYSIDIDKLASIVAKVMKENNYI
ncbi:hypothetical protein DICPUDRAFT_159885, partial [Dictyostelium purpureum]